MWYVGRNFSARFLALLLGGAFTLTACKLPIMSSEKTDEETATSEDSALSGVAHFVITPQASQLAPNGCHRFNLAYRDSRSNAAPVDERMNVYLSPQKNAKVYRDASCAQKLTYLTFTEGTWSKTFYLKDTVAEDFAIAIDPNGTSVMSGSRTIAMIPFGDPNDTTSGATVSGGSVTANGTSAATITVTLKDSWGNKIVGAVPVVEAGGTSNTLSACSASDSNGQSTCTLKSTKAEAKSLTVVSPVFLSAGSVTFVPDSASAVRVVTEPAGAAAGSAFTTQPVFELIDASGNRVTSSSATVTVSLISGSGSLQGSVNKTAVNGLVTFTNLQIDDTSDNKKLRAASSGLDPVDTAAFAVSPGAAAAVRFVTEPAGATAGSALTTQPVVDIVDAFNNRITSSNATVTLTLHSGAGSLDGTVSLAAVSGRATFTDLQVNDSSDSKTLRAASGLLGTADSAPFAVSPASASKLRFAVQPAGATAGSAFAIQPRVEVLDAFNNRITSSSLAIHIDILSGSGTLDGDVDVNASSGLATFSDLQINDGSDAKRLRASGGSLTVADSNSFTVSPGSAAKLKFVRQPAGATAGAAFTTQPQVEMLDTYNNRVTGSNATITLTLGTGSGTLDGDAAVAAVAGLATFTDLQINNAADAKVLHAATGGGVDPVDSSSFTVSHAAAASLQFATQPAGAVAGSAFGTQPVVEVIDAYGNRVTSFTDDVTLTLSTGTGTLGGTATQAASAGLASFSGLHLEVSGAKKLTATSGSFGVVSGSFTVSPASASGLRFAQQPGGATSGNPFVTQPQVEVVDDYNNRVTSSTASIHMALQSGAGALSGDVDVSAVSGLAAFTDLQIDDATNAKTLRATTGSFSVDSTAFNVSTGSAAAVRFVVQPAGAVAGHAFSTQPQVEVIDGSGNRVTSSSASVTLTLVSGAGSLTGSASATAVNGLASFDSLQINNAADAKVLRAASGVLDTEDSAAFTVTPDDAKAVRFVVQPGGAIAGHTLATQPQVEIIDAYGNRVISASSRVDIELQTGSGTLDGTPSQNASSGLAVFSDLQINNAADAKILKASSGSLTVESATPFSVTPGPAAALRYVVQPGNGIAGQAFSPQPQVEFIDAYSNRATGETGQITLSPVAGSGTLNGTKIKSATAGLASFSGLSFDGSGSKQIKAQATGLSLLPSTTFTVSPADATGLRFANEPAGAKAGHAFVSQPAVEVVDNLGNVVTTYSDEVQLTVYSGTGPLSGTDKVNAVNGVATFTGLKFYKTGAKVLRAGSGELNTVDTASFTVAPDDPAGLQFAVQPGGAVAGHLFTTQPQVEIIDAHGNRVTNSTLTVTLARGNGTGDLQGTVNRVAVAGLANFNDLRIDDANNDKTLVASATDLADQASETFSVTPDTAVALRFLVEPNGAIAGAPFSTQPSVEAIDAYGNRATSFTGDIKLTLTAGVGPLNGDNENKATAGVVSFSDLQLTDTTDMKILTATSSGLTDKNSNSFYVTHSSKAAIRFSTQPAGAKAGEAFSTQPVVEIIDAYGNRVLSADDDVTIALHTGSGSLIGHQTATASNGLASFSDLQINITNDAKVLQASATGLGIANSTGFTVTAAAREKILFVTQPAGAVAGHNFSTQPSVEVVDSYNNRVLGDASELTIALSAGTGPLAGDKVLQATDGYLEFTNLRLDNGQNSKTLTVTGDGLTDGVSSNFSVGHGAPALVAFIQQPAGAVAGVAFTTQPAVEIRDGYGNRATSYVDRVDISLKSGTGTLGGTTHVDAVAGVATFADLSLDDSSGNKVLTASSGELTVGDSTPFTVSASGAVALRFYYEPGAATAGSPFGAQPQVEVIDNEGHRVTSASNEITIALYSGTGPLFGADTTKSAINGLVTYSGLQFNDASDAKILRASASGLGHVDSAAINVCPGDPKKLHFFVQPVGGTAGSPLSTQPKVELTDNYGNRVTNADLHVTLSPVAGSGTYSGTLDQDTSAGLAAFTNVRIDNALDEKRLKATASDANIEEAISDPFTIGFNSAVALRFITQPGGAIAGHNFTGAPEIEIIDAYLNRVKSYGGFIEVEKKMGSGALAGTKKVNAVNGVATFAALRFDDAIGSKQLRAFDTDGHLGEDASSYFSVSPDEGSVLYITQQPSGAKAGAAFSVQPRIEIHDNYGNLVDSGALVKAQMVGGGGGFSGTAEIAADHGVASFTNLQIDEVTSEATLKFTSSGLADVTSADFEVTAGDFHHYVITGTTTPVAGDCNDYTITGKDAGGNTVTQTTSEIVAVGSDDGLVSVDATNCSAMGYSTSVTVPAYSSSVTFKMKGVLTGSHKLIADPSRIGVANAELSVAMVAAAGTAIDLASAPTPTVGSCNQLSVTVRDAYGNVANSPEIFAVDFTALASAKLYDSDQCAHEVSSPQVTFAAQDTIQSLYIRNDHAQQHTVIATAAGSGSMSGKSDNFLIDWKAGNPTKLLLSGPTSGTPGECVPLTVAVTDSLDNPITQASDYTANLSASYGSFYGLSDCNPSFYRSTALIPGSSSSVPIYYKSTSPGTRQLTATDPLGNWTQGQHEIIIDFAPVEQVADYDSVALNGGSAALLVSECRKVRLTLQKNGAAVEVDGPITVTLASNHPPATLHNTNVCDVSSEIREGNELAFANGATFVDFWVKDPTETGDLTISATVADAPAGTITFNVTDDHQLTEANRIELVSAPLAAAQCTDVTVRLRNKNNAVLNSPGMTLAVQLLGRAGDSVAAEYFLNSTCTTAAGYYSTSSYHAHSFNPGQSTGHIYLRAPRSAKYRLIVRATDNSLAPVVYDDVIQGGYPDLTFDADEPVNQNDGARNVSNSGFPPFTTQGMVMVPNDGTVARTSATSHRYLEFGSYYINGGLNMAARLFDQDGNSVSSFGVSGGYARSALGATGSFMWSPTAAAYTLEPTPHFIMAGPGIMSGTPQLALWKITDVGVSESAAVTPLSMMVSVTPPGDSGISQVVMDDSGNVYVVGYLDFSGTKNLYMAKYDATYLTQNLTFGGGNRANVSAGFYVSVTYAKANAAVWDSGNQRLYVAGESTLGVPFVGMKAGNASPMTTMTLPNFSAANCVTVTPKSMAIQQVDASTRYLYVAADCAAGGGPVHGGIVFWRYDLSTNTVSAMNGSDHYFFDQYDRLQNATNLTVDKMVVTPTEVIIGGTGYILSLSRGYLVRLRPDSSPVLDPYFGPYPSYPGVVSLIGVGDANPVVNKLLGLGLDEHDRILWGTKVTASAVVYSAWGRIAP